MVCKLNLSKAIKKIKGKIKKVTSSVGSILIAQPALSPQKPSPLYSVLNQILINYNIFCYVYCYRPTTSARLYVP